MVVKLEAVQRTHTVGMLYPTHIAYVLYAMCGCVSICM